MKIVVCVVLCGGMLGLCQFAGGDRGNSLPASAGALLVPETERDVAALADARQALVANLVRSLRAQTGSIEGYRVTVRALGELHAGEAIDVLIPLLQQRPQTGERLGSQVSEDYEKLVTAVLETLVSIGKPASLAVIKRIPLIDLADEGDWIAVTGRQSSDTYRRRLVYVLLKVEGPKVADFMLGEIEKEARDQRAQKNIALARKAIAESRVPSTQPSP